MNFQTFETLTLARGRRADLGTGGFKGAGGVMPLLRTAALPNTFQDWLSGACRILENLLATGAWPPTPRLSSWWEGNWLPLPKNHTPTLGPSGLAADAEWLSQHVGLGPRMDLRHRGRRLSSSVLKYRIL